MSTNNFSEEFSAELYELVQAYLDKEETKGTDYESIMGTLMGLFMNMYVSSGLSNDQDVEGFVYNINNVLNISRNATIQQYIKRKKEKDDA